MAQLSDNVVAALAAGAEAYPLLPETTYRYGTAGFRMKASSLGPAMFRVGVLAGLRSLSHGGAAVGVVVTASHNPVVDNGVKVVEPLGEMLVPSWEANAVLVANAGSAAELVAAVAAVLDAEGGIDVSGTVTGRVMYGWDTRPSGPELVAALEAGMAVWGELVQRVSLGIASTPQVHFAVRAFNDPTFGEPSQLGYATAFARAYAAVVDTTGGAGGDGAAASPLVIDCANGVGARALAGLLSCSARLTHITAVNTGSEPGDVLNAFAGADYVKSNQTAPPALASSTDRCAAFDGDADRVVYFYNDPARGFTLLDGDKIAALMAGFISKRLAVVEAAGLIPPAAVSVAVIQTAYANGASTQYIKNELGLPVEFTKTGVKHLHHAAVAYDVGVYFEANGHGTVVFSGKYVDTLRAAADAVELATVEPDVLAAVQQLRLLPALVNQSVGDAIADMLFVEAILVLEGMDVAGWAGLYSDLPNRLTKVCVADRTVFSTTNADQTVVAPAGIQDAIDALVAEVPNGRSFVRPSGTEDVVRVYAEAATQAAADDLALKVAALVYEQAAGVGDLVTSFD